MSAADRSPCRHKGGIVLAVLSAILLTTACAQLPPAAGHLGAAGARWGETNPHLQFLIRIHAGSAAERESMWRALKGSGKNGEVTEFRLALLQSVEGHSGHQPLQAESRLRTLLQKKPSAEIASVARLRLLELRNERQQRAATTELEAELAVLRAQLGQLLQIETQIDRGGGSKRP